MSKYGRMRDKQPGLSQWLLAETLTEHDQTMDHPFMKTIYQKSFSTKAYLVYLQAQQDIFYALERAVIKYHGHPLMSRLHDSGLFRSERLVADISFFSALHDSKERQALPSAQEYTEALEADVATSVELLIVHHMLQYLAVLSGGQFLKSCIRKKIPAANDKAGVAFYVFPEIGSLQMSTHVQKYMDIVDKLQFSDVTREQILACARNVYALSLKLMGECYDIERIPLVETTDAEKSGDGEKLSLNSHELLRFDGKNPNETRILISIRRKLYDVTAGRDMYGPQGSYSMFAGHDVSGYLVCGLHKRLVGVCKHLIDRMHGYSWYTVIHVTRCLATMNLKPECIDDLDYTPQTEREEKVLSDWEKKLAAKYVVCGTLQADATAHGGASRSPRDAVGTRASDTGAGPAACPFSGAAAGGDSGSAQCPFAAGSADKPAGVGQHAPGECPWPFVFLHAPRQGLQRKHLYKNIAVLAVVVAITCAYLR